MTDKQRIVLAYLSSPAAATAIPRLAERHGVNVVTLTLDVGQGHELAEIRARALTIGAARAHVIDVREDLARRSILAALQSSTPDVCAASGDVLPSLIAKYLADIARIEGITMVAVGTTSGVVSPQRDGRKRHPMSCLHALEPALTIVEMPPADAVSATTSRADRTIWGRVVEGVSPDDASSATALRLRSGQASGLFQLTRDPRQTPDVAAHVELAFDRGVPVRINGVDMTLIELVQSLETIAGAHGVGRFDLTRPAGDGRMRRAIGERPAARVLDAALGELRRAGLAGDGDGDQLPTIRFELRNGDCRVVGHQAGRLIAFPPVADGARRAEPALTS